MDTHYEKWYSPSLGRDMELKVYGRGGKPVLYIPCQDGRFFDFEGFKLTDTWSPWLESGQATVFAIDTMDIETFSDKGGDPYGRIRRHEAWIAYITNEVVPYIRSYCRGYGWQTDPGIMTFGCSLGATHAVNLYFRFPELFDGLLALSGVYDMYIALLSRVYRAFHYPDCGYIFRADVHPLRAAPWQLSPTRRS